MTEPEVWIGGHIMVVLAEREDEGVKFRCDRLDSTLTLDAETLFLVSKPAWDGAEGADQLCVFVPAAGGVDLKLRAPKHMFREIQIMKGTDATT